MSSLGSWGAMGRGCSQLPDISGRLPLPGHAEPPCLRCKSGARARLFGDCVDAESRRATGCKEEYGWVLGFVCAGCVFPDPFCPLSHSSAPFSAGQATLSVEDKPFSTCSLILK